MFAGMPTNNVVSPRFNGSARVQKVSTLLVCGNVLLQSGIRSILSGTPFDLPDATDGDAFHPHLILVAGMRSLGEVADSAKKLKSQHASARIVVLVDHIEPKDAVQLLKLGVSGICSATMESQSFLKALELVMLGEIFAPAEVVKWLLSEPAPAQSQKIEGSAGLMKSFSAREAQILRSLMQGASNKTIARKLGVAEATVKVHVKAVLRKLNAANRTQAAMWAQQNLDVISGSTMPSSGAL